MKFLRSDVLSSTKLLANLTSLYAIGVKHHCALAQHHFGISQNITKGDPMIYRVDKFTENNINPITNNEYDESWLVLTLSKDIPEPMLVGSNNGSAYTIKISKQIHPNWKMAVGDFIDYCNDNNLNGIVAITENEYQEICRFNRSKRAYFALL